MKTTHSRPTQAEQVVNYMQEYGEITQLDALRDLGIMRLGARIFELKKRGYVITTTHRCVPTRSGEKTSIAVYRLKSTKAAQ